MIGHEWAVEILRRHTAQAEMSHAYLIAGPPGVGRRTLALRFAQALNCPEPAAPGEPCGVCRSCVLIQRMQHPDLAVTTAEVEGGTLKVEQVRELQHRLALAPYEGRFRIALLLRFQEAHPSAANALLKTLEEPPEKVILLLTADAPEALLPTIVSRCELLRLRPLSLECAAAALEERGAPADQARLLAHLSGGRIGAALCLLDDPAALETRQERLDDLLRLLGGTRRERFAYAEKLTEGRRIARDGSALRETLATWLAYWRDVMLCAAGAAAPLTNPDREAELRRLADRVGFDAAHRCVGALEAGLVGLDGNLNPRLLCEVLLLDWPRA